MSDEQKQDQALAVVVGEQLARRPVIELVNPQQLALIKNRVAPNATNGEVGQFLELCVAYGLDPYAGEAWCAKSRGQNGGEGRLLIMVGRDGLRKIAHRNGLDIDGDVVRLYDDFEVKRDPKTRERTILHAYTEAIREDRAKRDGDQTPEASARGPIVGAWAEVYDQAGKQRGYFYAPLTEYRPTNPKQLQYSPWGSQESVMILAAAERQALRQATPLGGLLAEGEDARIDEGPRIEPADLSAIVSNFVEDEQTLRSVVAVIERARAVAHGGLSDVATIEMTLTGQSQEFVDQWLHEAVLEVERAEAQAQAQAVSEAQAEVVTDAEVVGEGGDAPPEDGGGDSGGDEDAGGEEKPDPTAVLEGQAADLRLDADAAEEGGDADAAEKMRDDADRLESQAAELRAADAEE